MTNLATPLHNGPFGGFFSPESVLYALDPALTVKDRTVEYVIVSGLDEDDVFPAETVVYAAYENGDVDGDFYMHHRAVTSLYNDNNPAHALERIGYTVAGSDD